MDATTILTSRLGRGDKKIEDLPRTSGDRCGIECSDASIDCNNRLKLH